MLAFRKSLIHMSEWSKSLHPVNKPHLVCCVLIYACFTSMETADNSA